MDTQDTGETIVPLFLDKVGQSPQVPTQQESLSDLLGLAAEDWCRPHLSSQRDHGGIWGSYQGSQEISVIYVGPFQISDQTDG